MLQIAVYGKGGIGKSTIAANISFELSRRGSRVLQIGCDPKHDSTRLLLNGARQNTVLEYLRSTPKEHRKLEDVVLDGASSVKCIEAGGPEPGVGCAGRGILTMFDFLEKSGIDNIHFDYKLYDVLGDVVCGGFAVPLRKNYADAVYIVTSGEFMSLYAANNILKGILNYDDGNPRVGGLILNCRGNAGEYEYVKNFADGVQLPIVSTIGRDQVFSEAESNVKTVMEMFPESTPAKAIAAVVDDIEKVAKDKSRMYRPHPLDDETMDKVAKGIPLTLENSFDYARVRNPVDDCHSLRSCTAMGAVPLLSHIEGLHSIIHGPSSCPFMLFSFANGKFRVLNKDGLTVWDHVTCTNLDDSASVFGGIKNLEAAIRDRYDKGDRVMAVVTMCVPGVIGDNIVDCCNVLSKELGVTIIPMPMDGIAMGMSMQGQEIAFSELMKLVEPVPMEKKDLLSITLIDDYRATIDRDAHLDRGVEELFELAGVSLNSMFPAKCSVEDIIRLGKAKYVCMNKDRMISRKMRDILCEATGCISMEEPLPRSMAGIDRWLDEISEITGNDVSVARSELHKKYEAGIRSIRKRTKGKKVIIVKKPDAEYDWFYEIAEDLGMEIIKTRDTTYNRWVMGADLTEGKVPYTSDQVGEDIDELKPDLVLSEVISDMYLKCRTGMIGIPFPGVDGIIDYVKKLDMRLNSPVIEKWRYEI